ncbi:MFS transporter [Alicyclobacillus fastidiosus]|nr:MFS transporter [Alicyclobacillus fastidiosus]
MYMTQSKVGNGRWLRIMPIAFIMYTFAYIDRNNIGFGFAGMQKDLGFSAAYSGLAGGIFFIGFLVFQVHGGIWARKYGARKVITICLVIWSVFAFLTGTVHNIAELLAVRFILGMVEGIVWPASLILISNWFPQKERARATAYFMLGTPISAIIMSPISGYLLDHTSWRVMFFIEAIPPLAWALLWWFGISDKPSLAKWISKEEKDYIETSLASENSSANVSKNGFLVALKDRNVMVLSFSGFFGIMGLYGLGLWLPTVVKTITHGSNTMVGLISALPWISAMIGSIVISHLSDRTGNHKGFYALICTSGTIFLLVATFAGTIHPYVAIIALICLNLSFAKNAPFWAIPTAVLSRDMLPNSIGIINGIGNLGGFLAHTFLVC